MCNAENGEQGAVFSLLPSSASYFLCNRLGVGFCLKESPPLTNAAAVFLEWVKWISRYRFFEGSDDEHRLNEFKSQRLGLASLYLSLPICKVGIIIVPVSLTCCENYIS